MSEARAEAGGAARRQVTFFLTRRCWRSAPARRQPLFNAKEARARCRQETSIATSDVTAERSQMMPEREAEAEVEATVTRRCLGRAYERVLLLVVAATARHAP